MSDAKEADDAEAAVHALLRLPEPPTALFTARNNLTIGALRALHQAGAHRQLAIVGFDDFPLADLVEPAVTVVAQDVEAIGAKVAELLLARLDGVSTNPQQIVVPTSLLARGSGEIPPPSRLWPQLPPNHAVVS